MAISSYSFSHKGAALVIASDVCMVRVIGTILPTLAFEEDGTNSPDLNIQVDAGLLNGVEQGMTRVTLDWETACEVAYEVERRREQMSHEAHSAGLRTL